MAIAEPGLTAAAAAPAAATAAATARTAATTAARAAEPAGALLQEGAGYSLNARLSREAAASAKAAVVRPQQGQRGGETADPAADDAG